MDKEQFQEMGLQSATSGSVTVSVGDVNQTKDVTEGIAKFTFAGLSAGGVYSVSAVYYNDGVLEAYNTTGMEVFAKSTITASDITRGVNSPYDAMATFTDKYGNPLKDTVVSFTVDGVTYNATTDSNGIAYLSAGLGVVNQTATKYGITALNTATGESIVFTSTIVPRVVVLSGDLTADYLENPAYVVQVFGDDGNPVGEGEIVTVVFSGYYYYMPTNATGHVVRTIGLAPGMYAVKAGYMDYNVSATVFSVKQILTASSGTLKKTAKSYTLKATLKNTNGKAIAGKTVKLTFNGKTYKATTNSKGVASYTIKTSVINKLKAGKTYKLTAKYVNDVTKGKYVGKIKVVKKQGYIKPYLFFIFLENSDDMAKE